MPPRTVNAERDDFSLHVGVLASLILHALFLPLLLRTKAISPPRPFEVIDVSFELPKPAEPAEKRTQMVSPSEKTEEIPPSRDVARESDVDSQVIKEQIRRGAENTGPALGPKSAAAERPASKPIPAKREPKRAERSPPKIDPLRTDDLPRGADLKLDNGTLLNEFALGKTGGSKNASAARPFSRPEGSGAMFIGLSGSSDYLPDLPDGDITLLNAKANQFAVFVRRVAIQVFTQIRATGWQNLSAQEVRAIGTEAAIEAVLSPKGELLKVLLLQTSESRNFDDLILKAAKNGTRDPNPPEGARAADGNIHFVFKSRSWSEVGPGRGGFPTERRWILLETGLE